MVTCLIFFAKKYVYLTGYQPKDTTGYQPKDTTGYQPKDTTPKNTTGYQQMRSICW